MEQLKELKGFLPFSLIDWPGTISAVLFFSGCNLACPTCHNFELAKKGANLPTLNWRDVFLRLKEDKKWLEGVVLTGGEVTLLSYLPRLCLELKKIDYLIKIDSNGLRPEVLRVLLEEDLADMLAIDVKGPFSKYAKLTGVSLDEEVVKAKFQEIFKLAQKWPERFYFRITRVPFLEEQDLEEVKSYLPKGFNLHVQKYIQPKGGKYAYTN